MRRVCCSVLLAAIASSNATASPVINSVSPRAVIPGHKTVLALTGSNLENVTNLWTSFGPVAERIGATNGTFSFHVSCPREAAGIGAIQAYGPEGISEIHLIAIDPIATAKTNLLAAPFATDGVFRAEQIDFYPFDARAGQEISIEVLAHRIGSQADPVLRVLDPNGRELGFCDDAEGVWRDPRLRFKAPAGGRYSLTVHDVGYAGGNGYFYRLRLGDFPIVWQQFPLRDGAETGTREPQNNFTSSSPANPDSAVWFSKSPMLIEYEPNDSHDSAQEFDPPAILNGRFGCETDRDFYRFHVAKDQKLVFKRQSRSLGSPCDVALRILNSGGEILAETDGRTLDETGLTRQFNSPGEYLLEIRELTGTAPTNSAYRVQVQNYVPGFRLTTEVNRLEVAAGSEAKMKIACERFDYDGEIQLTALGVQLGNATIPANKKETEVRVKLTNDLPYFHFTLEGKGTNGFRTRVKTRPALLKAFPLVLTPPPDLDGRIVIGLKR